MRNLGYLKAQVRRYLTSNTSLVSVIPGQAVNAGDLASEIDAAILVAANNARKTAEMRHDFQATIMTGSGIVSVTTPLNLDEVTIGENLTANFKSLMGVAVANSDGSYSPMRVVSHQTRMGAVLRQQELYTNDFRCGYQAVVQGRYVTLEPLGDESVDIRVFGSIWMPDYDQDTDTDWFLLHGFEYMQWATICDVNHMLLKFVPRQEGTLNPPERARDLALENLIVLDSYALQGSIMHDL